MRGKWFSRRHYTRRIRILCNFPEQGTPVSHMAAAKMLGAIARMDGDNGEDSDAVGAYTQVPLKDAWQLLGESKDILAETWITLPRHRRPKEWDNIKDPDVLLEKNRYGHPLAGLPWDKHCEKGIYAVGSEKVQDGNVYPFIQPTT
jgi:hypothetical protein